MQGFIYLFIYFLKIVTLCFIFDKGAEKNSLKDNFIVYTIKIKKE